MLREWAKTSVTRRSDFQIFIGFLKTNRMSKNAFAKILFCLCLSFLVNATHGQIVINELMASNAATIEDPDFGSNADWIELYNQSPSSFDLSGFYLSDNMDDPFKWQIPTGTIVEGERHILFWADGKDTSNHCNFKLSKDGEKIGLFSPVGELLDSVFYENQNTDVSYGRLVDGNGPLVYFIFPSPELMNGGESFDGLTFYKPRFSKEGGIFNDPLSLILFSTNGNVHFTTDGTEPTIDSPVFTNPIYINSTIVIRARVFETDKLPGKVITHSYFFDEDFEERNLPVVSIVTNPDFSTLR